MCDQPPSVLDYCCSHVIPRCMVSENVGSRKVPGRFPEGSQKETRKQNVCVDLRVIHMFACTDLCARFPGSIPE